MSLGILLSGGIDSTALAYWKKPQYAFTIDYGQLSAKGEIRAAKKVSKELGIYHEVITVDCSQLGSGEMAGSAPIGIAPVPEWWPFRNQLLLTIACMRAVAIGVSELLVGSVKTDGVHSDGTEAFFKRADDLISMQEGNIRILVPAIDMNSTELIGVSGIGLPLLGWTHSCHKGEFACGVCRGCTKHTIIIEELEGQH